MASYAIELKRSAERDLRKINPTLIPAILSRIEALAEIHSRAGLESWQAPREFTDSVLGSIASSTR